jgi:uncharacterized membrane-anchored protein
MIGQSDIAISPNPARALAATPRFWLVMFTASAFGTNLGDFWVDGLGLDGPVSFLILLAICGLCIVADRRLAARSELAYWAGIVLLRAAATNLGDIITHDLAISYAAAAVVLGCATLQAGRTTRDGGAGSPLIDLRYWGTMGIAGVFGTIAGDLTSHHLGLYLASVLLVAILVMALAVRTMRSPAMLLAYWAVVLIERAAATPVADSIESHRALGLGLPVALLCTGGAFLAAMMWRRHAGD